MTFETASEILSTKLALPVGPGSLSREQEAQLVRYVGSPLFLVDWPVDRKPFYMKRTAQNTVS